MTVVVIVVAVVVAIATYLTWLASRLDRLARRVGVARAGLVTQLVARAEAAYALAVECDLAELRSAAERVRGVHAALTAGAALDRSVEDAENALSRALRAPAVAEAGQRAPARLHAVDAAAARVALARQLHNDAVGDVRALAGRRLVRVLHLGGRRPIPSFFEIDDALPVREDGEPGPDGPGDPPAGGVSDVRPAGRRGTAPVGDDLPEPAG